MPRKGSREQQYNRQSKGRWRKAGQWGGSGRRSRRDSWEGSQHAADAVSLWSSRNFREFTHEGLYFLLALVHLMRAGVGAVGGVETRGER